MLVPGSTPNIILSFIIFLKTYKGKVLFQKNHYLCGKIFEGALAHPARALDWQSKGDEFDPRMLHPHTTKAHTYLIKE